MAVYDIDYIEYGVEFKDYNVDSLPKQNYHWGDTVTPPAAPTGEADNTYAYEFSKWNKDEVNCAGSIVELVQYIASLVAHQDKEAGKCNAKPYNSLGGPIRENFVIG